MKILTNIPQGYKSSPLGIIPKDWEIKRLGEVATSFSGGTPKSGESKFYGGSIPFIRSGEIHSNSTELFLTEDGLSNSSAKLVKKGDLLYALYGATSGEVDISKIDGAINQAILCIQSSKVNLRFVCNYLNCKKDYITSKFLQGGQGNLSSDIVMSFQISLPPSLAEQQKIVECLGTWDKAIEMQKQLIDKLELRKKGLMQQLLPAKGHRVPNLRFPEFVNTMKWTEKRVADIFQITRGLVLATTSTKNKPDTKYKYPVYSSQTKDGGLMGYYDNFLYEDAITWTTDGANAGTVFFRSGKFYCTNVCGVLINKEGYANQCLAEIIGKQSKKYVSYVGNPKLMNNVMAEIPVCVPSLQELRKIACFLSSIDEQTATEKNKLALFQVQKQGLMQVLLTGKKRISLS